MLRAYIAFIVSSFPIAAQVRSTQTLVLQAPSAMIQCESDQCTRGGGGAIWIFQGQQGQAMWRFSAIANLTVKQFDGHTIVIHREDPNPSYSSPRFADKQKRPDGVFFADYTGTIHGNRIDGTVVWNGGGKGTWYAIIPPKLCEPFSGCPLTAQQVFALGQNSLNAKLDSAALTCFKIAANQNDRDAETELAQMYESGIGIPKDAAQASFWKNRALNTVSGDKEDRGYAQKPSACESDALAEAAFQRAFVAGNSGDLLGALHCYQIAEEKGKNRASVYIGEMYLEGVALPKDPAKGLQEFETAANNGDALAMEKASTMYEQGLGINKNPLRAAMWTERFAKRRAQFAPICSNVAVTKAMNALMRQFHANPLALAGRQLEKDIGRAMNLEINEPDLHVVGTQPFDIESDDNFTCDATMAITELSPSRPTQDADDRTVEASELTNRLVNNLRPVQEFRLKKVGSGSTYTVLLESIGSSSQGTLHITLPQPYTQSVSIH